ncbi:unnamed protein product [Dicrocoelium dendriticum]|nr:unnamed protein product [Dicrocoelium dendriticum]
MGIQSKKLTTFKSDCGILMHFNSTVDRVIKQTPQIYCLIGESLRPNLLKQLEVLPHFSENGYTNSQYQPLMKLLRLVSFSGRLPPNMDLNVRVYVIPDTTESLARVVHLEQQLDGHMLGISNQFSFQDIRANLCFVVNSLSEGWRSRLQVNTQEIPFRHIWSGTQVSTLHCAFTFKHADVMQTSISCKITFFQVTNWNQCETLHISYDATKPPEIYLPFENAHPTHNVEKDAKLRRLSSETKSKLSSILDHSGEWQLLAGELGFEGMVPQMVSRTTPTFDLLDL